MSKVIKFDKSLYGTEGLIPLFLADDWLLSGKVVDASPGREEDVDLSLATGATAYFESLTAGFPISQAVGLSGCGKISISVPFSKTALAAEAPEGRSCYIVVQFPTQLMTIPTKDKPLKVTARGFESP